IKGKGSAPGAQFQGLTRAEAGFKVTFAQEGAVVMRSAGSHDEWIRDPRDVRKQIVNLMMRNEWNEDWWFLNRVTRAKTGLVLISKGEAASALVSASAKIDKTKASIGFEVKAWSGDLSQYPENHGWVVQFEPLRVRWS